MHSTEVVEAFHEPARPSNRSLPLGKRRSRRTHSKRWRVVRWLGGEREALGW